MLSLYRVRVHRVSLRTVFVVVVSLVVLFHLVTVTLAAMPTNRWSDAARPVTGHLAPYFTQNWRLFAPNPISSDRAVQFQAQYVDASGESVQSAWVDWTDVELDLIRHRLVGGRAGYVTNKMFTPLSSRYAALNRAQKAVADDDLAAAGGLDELGAALRQEDGSASAAELYLRYERVVVRLASDVLLARFPDADLTSVRYRIVTRSVVPFDARSGDEDARALARPAPTSRTSAWRPVEAGGPSEREVVKDFDERHR